MPRYYFHLYNDHAIPDVEGQELPDLGAAREEAIRCAKELAAHEVLDLGELGLRHRIDIHDEEDKCVARVRFEDVVAVSNAGAAAASGHRIHDEPSKVSADAKSVLMEGPGSVCVALTPKAADETGRRLIEEAEHAAIE